MEEGGVKAPVTRLRRSLSVDQSDEIKSSSGTNTPTKKRAGRLAAKPDLELINENAPVTRLRKSLSVEQSDEAKSSSGTNTPTKKRGGRLAAKPELELIDENSADSKTPKRLTKTAIVKDIEGAEEKQVTPSRRSTRIKSNSSIVSETTQTFDSPRAKRAARRISQVDSDNEATPTPARQTRRTRKDSASNADKAEIQTSTKASANVVEIIAEESEHNLKTTVKADNQNSPLQKSPRVIKKGPHKQSIEPNEDNNTNTSDDLIMFNKENEKIEESGSNLKMPTNYSEKPVKQQNLSFEQSPSVVLVRYEYKQSIVPVTNGDKNTSITTELNTSNKENEKIEESKSHLKKPANDSEKPAKVISPLRKSLRLSTVKNPEAEETAKNVSLHVDSNDSNSKVSDVVQNKLSISSAELINQIDNTSTKKKRLSLNNSSSSVENRQNDKNKRQRTKSWTNPGGGIPLNDTNCYSDTESVKKKKENLLNDSSNIDLKSLPKNYEVKAAINNNTLQNKTDGKDDDNIINSPNRKNTRKLLSPNVIKTTAEIGNLNVSLKKKRESIKSNSSTDIDNDRNTSLYQKEKQNLYSPSQHNKIEAGVLDLFDKDPNKDMQVTVLIEDSNTNSDKINKQTDNEDQCVPEVESHIVSQETTMTEVKNQTSFNFGNESQKYISKERNDSCEPMDIDETLPNNITQPESQIKTLDKPESRSFIKNADEVDNKAHEKSLGRKSLIFSTSQTNDKTGIESKSTLVLSQLKDISSNENDVSQSPQLPADKVLSKSDCILDVTQNKEENNRSLNYLTSTPLQQKKLKLKKIGLPVNTSAIAVTDDASKVEENASKNLSKNNMSSSSSRNRHSSEESDSEEGSSKGENNFIDNEADEASDDYESGDSKDGDVEQYIRENEIVERGVTLTSEEELSNDTDYEKDSFIVSSNEEDNELLDGSGDDLSMSDNELKMTAKSKKKYNERKIKEQKNASREMFESRHKLNMSNKSANANSSRTKNKQNVFQSSDSEDEDVGVKLKKKNRRRLDSSHDTSVNKSLETNKSREATSNKSLLNEVEMSVCEEIVKETDPLTISIKQEKHQQDINSSVQFIDSDNLKENSYNKDKSHINDVLADPFGDSNDEECTDSSDNEHIQNYDSILNELNKSNKTKKTKEFVNVSLNLDKKTKNKKATSLVEQLNLTQTKVKKLKKTRNEDEVDSQMNNAADINGKLTKDKNKETLSKNDSDDEASSDSIDLHLLFSEESNSSEDTRTNVGNIEISKPNNDEDFIPLKKSNGKTNIVDCSGTNNTSVHDTKKKNKKRKTFDKSQDDSGVLDDESNVQFIIDTTGSLGPLSNATSEITGNLLMEQQNDEDSDAPLEVSNKSVKEKQFPSDLNSSVSAEKSQNKSMTKTPKSEKKKKKRLSETQAEEANENVWEVPGETDSIQEHIVLDNIEENELDTDTINKSYNSVAKTPKSDKKKKKRLSESLALQGHSEFSIIEGGNVEEHDVEEKEIETVNISMSKTPKSEKKKNKKLSVSQSTEQISDLEFTKPEDENVDELITEDKDSGTINISMSKTPKSEKKKNKKLSVSQSTEQINDLEFTKPEDENVEELIIEDKDSGTINISMSKTPKSEKKKKKKLSESQSTEQILNEISNAECHNILLKESKKQRKSIPNDSIIADEIINKSFDKILTPSTEKKKKSKLSKSIDGDSTENANHSLNMTLSTKKKKIMLETVNIESTDNITESSEDIVKSKKRKRNSSISPNDKNQGGKEDGNATINKTPTLNLSVTSNSQKKKRKVSHTEENSENTDNDNKIDATKTMTSGKIHMIDKKKTKYSINETNIKSDTICTDINQKKANNKRKEREDDDGTKISKVMKANSCDKLLVPRLPNSIIKQLEDKHRKKKAEIVKSKTISTSKFVVEETIKRKNKPSNYLEESVYINEYDLLESKKQKGFIKKPKVLPFLPTASTSSSGYTTNFTVNVLPKEIQFVAKSSNVSNYKNDYLQSRKIKLGTYEFYKRNRNVKMSKF